MSPSAILVVTLHKHGTVPGDYQMHGHGAEETRELFERTVAYWRTSLARYRGRWRDSVYRSALTLELLT